jgi:hypothetical protein
MNNFKTFLQEAAVKVDVSRYKRSHGKNPPKTAGGWMFTNARIGDGDVFSAPYGSYQDNVKKAKEWAKEKGYSVIYVME